MSNVRFYLGPAIRGAVWVALLSFVAWAGWGYRQQNEVGQDIAEAYEFVIANGQVSTQLPCFCGCKQRGHASLDMCFVSRRDKAGRMIARDSHAETCDICIEVALLAAKLHKKNATPEEIKRAVQSQYGDSSSMNPDWPSLLSSAPGD